MNAAELLKKRKPEWQELEALLEESKRITGSFSKNPDKIARFTMLYRSVCSDLALAESYQLPTGTIRYLNGIVGRAHHSLYCTSRSGWGNFTKKLVTDVPRWILTDITFWLALVLFWVPFGVCVFVSHQDSSFPERVVGKDSLITMNKMYDQSFDDMSFNDRVKMAGFYIKHNGGIGLQCFAMGILGGICGIWILLSNSIKLGVIFGYMTSTEVSTLANNNFTNFVTAHGPFELTAIVLSAAAGMKMGFAFFATHGYARIDSVRLATRKAAPIMTVAITLFCLAALIEAFISPNPFLPFFFKQCIAVFSTALLLFYIFGLGGIAQFRHVATSLDNNPPGDSGESMNKTDNIPNNISEDTDSTNRMSANLVFQNNILHHEILNEKATDRVLTDSKFSRNIRDQK